ncbi:M23 family metallopeptidase [Winogradskyella maritima]|uniref:M23 family metallopeptidase n=1 Tax=Winogradskyella maritima TaxID=1517766 RepID=A0ABV8AHL1_9FLAO|nr:M23 family metallopeptidase [Winogradskyella maritima]
MNRVFLLALSFLFFNCNQEKPTKPNFISFKLEKDSIKVIAKNYYLFPIHFKIENLNTDSIQVVNTREKSETEILALPSNQFDSIKILNTFKFKGEYGIYNLKDYDSNYNYALPFKDGYTSELIQGYTSDFTHKGAYSQYSLDFGMAIGDTITASRGGRVVRVEVSHNMQGDTVEFNKYGNYIMVYHTDGTFSQYVHLKQNGNLVALGDSVAQGQPIALSGFTGWTTMPHLHLAVYKPGKNGLESIKIIMDSVPAERFKIWQKFKQ